MRIVLGLWLLQAVSAGSAWLVLSSGDRGEVFAWIAVVMGMGLLAALWFCTALRDQRRLGEAQRSERLASKNAELHAKLARQQAEDAASLRTLTQKVSESRPRMLKAGFLAGGAVGLGIALVVTQVFAVGLLVVAFAGGGAAGYAVRGWLQNRAVAGLRAAIPVDATSPAPLEAPAPRSKILRLRPVRANAA